MRDPKRIKPFLEWLGEIWERECPDWRFGQLMSNVLGVDPFYIEDEDARKTFEEYFNRKGE